MRVAGEEDEQRISPELEDVAAAAVGDADQPLEDPADRQHELFGARASPGLQPLRERGEAAEVDRDERAVELAPAIGRRMLRPVENEPWQIRLERSLRLRVHPATSVNLTELA